MMSGDICGVRMGRGEGHYWQEVGGARDVAPNPHSAQGGRPTENDLALNVSSARVEKPGTDPFSFSFSLLFFSLV